MRRSSVVKESGVFNMKIAVGNAAFGSSEEEAISEVIIILKKVISNLDSGKLEGTLKDSNGNNVGSFNLSVEV